MCSVFWPLQPAPLLSIPPEPSPCGREVLDHLSKRPWGMTLIQRQARETSAVWSHKPCKVRTDRHPRATFPPKGFGQTPPETPSATLEGSPFSEGADAGAVHFLGLGQQVGRVAQGEARAIGQSQPRPRAWLPSCSLPSPEESCFHGDDSAHPC